MIGRLRVLVVVLAVATAAADLRADQRFAVRGMVLAVDPARHTMTVSHEPIAGLMPAMVMPFAVRDVAELSGLVPGAIVFFTLVVDDESSHAEDIRIRRFDTVEQDPLAARRLALLRLVASGEAREVLAPGQVVPDFTLIDQTSRPFTLSSQRGRVVAVNFMYTTCQLPDYCLRLVNHFGVLRERFAGALGRDLLFVTMTFDPVRDQPDVLDRYAAEWDADPAAWRFLTGRPADVTRVLDWFAVSAFPKEGLMDHTLHTVVIDRDGTLVANIEGNDFATDQLGDLIQAVLDGSARTHTRTIPHNE